MTKQEYTSNKANISAVIITLNEARNIIRCINSVRWADEIIIVDSGSTDNTCEIAKSFSDKVKTYYNPWPGDGMQKRFGIDKANSKWILIIDADEEISPKLAANIQSKIKSSPENDCFKIKRKSYFLGKKIKYGDWGKDWITRVFAKNNYEWTPNKVHSGLKVKKKNVIALNGSIYHHTQDTIHSSVQKANDYSSGSADISKQRGKKSSFLKAILKSKWAFYRSYLFRLGFLDGIHGYIIAKNIELNSRLKQFKIKLEDNDYIQDLSFINNLNESLLKNKEQKQKQIVQEIEEEILSVCE